MIKLFCDRCEQPGKLTAHTFEVGNILLLEVILRSREAGPTHFCENCLAEMMWESIQKLSNSTIAAELRKAQETAAEADAYRERSQELIKTLSLEKETASKQAQQDSALAKELEKKLHHEQEQVNGLVAQLRKVRTEVEARAKRAVAEIRQRIEDERSEPEYINSTTRRERIRSGG